ncbi:hypothetical protein DAEQUDRAFT_764394 [Daedalea quercina L-15889]|uniref:Uncharacterized protein n=1 Tax=Daedalea quercina L-15889 TaxID=1314783 RepID=A0A165RJD7_9APHY|nr:hypothetical protein DAEQUDRAFT_764394 [Daedalea quercina L-15889]
MRGKEWTTNRPQYMLELESRVAAAVHGWGPDMLDVLRPSTPAAIIITIACYDHMDNIDAKVQIALFGTLVIAVDDPTRLPAVHDFHRRLCLGSVQGDVGIVGRPMEIISGM